MQPHPIPRGLDTSPVRIAETPCWPSRPGHESLSEVLGDEIRGAPMEDSADYRRRARSFAGCPVGRRRWPKGCSAEQGTSTLG